MSDPVKVRMYNVGFGDSFLVTIPAEDRPRKILIDCGYHSAGPPPKPIAEVVRQIIEDVKEDGGPRIDVVIATHRHRDHVVGFERADWSRVRVGEVWMPWTEHPSDPEARRIRERQARKARRLMAAFAAMDLAPALRDRLLEIAGNSLTNAKAMHMLHNGFSGVTRRRFLPEENDAQPTLRIPLLPDVAVHVLGPSRAESVIREMEPPEDEAFLRAALQKKAGPEERLCPFKRGWMISPCGKAFEGWFGRIIQGADRRRKKTVSLRPDSRSFPHEFVRSLGLRWSDLQAIATAAEDDPFLAAVALDKAVNGTSLMLMFEVGRAFLLFPGDAQFGTWNAAMENPASRELLARTSFYKVGHHGSHNATPRSFVEDILGEGIVAMVPTRATTHYKRIPRKPLLMALKDKPGKVARSDEAQVTAPFVKVGEICTETKIAV